MATRIDKILEVTPDTDEVFALDCSAWEVIAANDTIASGVVTWETTDVPTTVGTPAASSPADEFLNIHITGFSKNTDGSTKSYFMQAKVTTTGGAVEDFYVKFVCGEPTGF